MDRDKNKVFVIGLLTGGFVGGYVLKWTPVGKEAYLVTHGQLFYIVALLVGFGAVVATLTQYPWLRVKKKIIQGRGTPVAVEYIMRNGEVKLDVVRYDSVIEYDGKMFKLREPSFSFLGMRGYRLHEDCAVSLDFDNHTLEEAKQRLAGEIAEQTTVKKDGEEYSLIPAPITLRALHPLELRHAYATVMKMAIHAAETRAEKMIRMTFVLSVLTLLAAAAAAYYAYTDSQLIEAVGKSVRELIALVKAKGG